MSINNYIRTSAKCEIKISRNVPRNFAGHALVSQIVQIQDTLLAAIVGAVSPSPCSCLGAVAEMTCHLAGQPARPPPSLQLHHAAEHYFRGCKRTAKAKWSPILHLQSKPVYYI
jgi:hypothetical protein